MKNKTVILDVMGGWIPFIDMWECPNCKNLIHEFQRKCICG